MRVAAIVVAAGSGERFGSRKQFADLAGTCAACRSVAASRSVADLVVLVAPHDALDDRHGADQVVAGGATRSASVRAGLAATPWEFDTVVVHDAARPLASPALFAAVLAALDGDARADGAVPALAVTDTVKRVGKDGAVLETLSRDELVAVQTPQGFRAATLRRAHATAPEATDDAALLEAIGARVVVVPGERANRKITTPEDLDAARAALAAR